MSILEEHSSRDEVRSSISDGWEVIWGNHLEVDDYARFVAAVGSGTVVAYFADLLKEQIASFGLKFIVSVFQADGGIVGVVKAGRVLEYSAGLATYRYWHEVYNPFRQRTEKVAFKPNTHQPYLRWRLATSGDPISSSEELRSSLTYDPSGLDEVLSYYLIAAISHP